MTIKEKKNKEILRILRSLSLKDAELFFNYSIKWYGCDFPHIEECHFTPIKGDPKCIVCKEASIKKLDRR